LKEPEPDDRKVVGLFLFSGQYRSTKKNVTKVRNQKASDLESEGIEGNKPSMGDDEMTRAKGRKEAKQAKLNLNQEQATTLHSYAGWHSHLFAGQTVKQIRPAQVGDKFSSTAIVIEFKNGKQLLVEMPGRQTYIDQARANLTEVFNNTNPGTEERFTAIDRLSERYSREDLDEAFQLDLPGFKQYRVEVETANGYSQRIIMASSPKDAVEQMKYDVLHSKGLGGRFEHAPWFRALCQHSCETTDWMNARVTEVSQ